jgi:DMSO/TMAO reductase YedYZ molybdopterin-dependent catalytic subunit
MRSDEIVLALRAGLCAVLTAIAVVMLSSLALADPPPAGIAVGGHVQIPLTYTREQLAALPHRTIDISHNGRTAKFEGVPVQELLQRAGVPLGEQLRGEDLSLVVLVTAVDGYRAVFALAELDELLGAREVLLADRRDGHPLGDDEGPYRLVVPGDAGGGRWVRQVRRIELRSER